MNADKDTIQNLIDAGCSEIIIKQFASFAEKNDTSAQLKLLYAHRKELLDTVHKDQSRLSCLDYLIYHMRKM